MKIDLQEISIGGRELHETLLAQAVLFYLPYDAARVSGTTVGELIESSRAWRTSSVIPYPITATKFKYRPDPDERAKLMELSEARRRRGMRVEPDERDGYDETAVFTIGGDGKLLYSVHTVFWPEPDLRAEFYTTASDDGKDVKILRPTETTARMLKERAHKNTLFMTEIMGGLARLSFLLEALTSVGYSGVALPGPSRQVARSTGEPRKQFEVVIRKRGDRHVTPAREQFAEVMRQAHMVRAHMRTNWRTGQKTIKVRNFERGGRGTVEKPTYRILDES